MRYTAALFALVSATLAAAQLPNPFHVPSSGYAPVAGQPLDLEWTPSTPGNITLLLRNGNPENLDDGRVIAASIVNSGAYTWTPGSDIPSGPYYAIQIVDDTDLFNTNYTPFFYLDTPTPAVEEKEADENTDGDDSSSDSSDDGPDFAAMEEAYLSMLSATLVTSTLPSASSTATATSATATTTFTDVADSEAANAAARPTAMVGMLGLAALGVLAL